MTLTRHFYDLDEVTAALEYCLHNGYGRAQFWTWELLVSWEPEVAINTLRTTWLRQGGAYDLGLAKEFTTPPTKPLEWIKLLLRVQAAIRAAGTLTALRFLNTAVAPVGELPPIFQTYHTKQRRMRADDFLSLLDAGEIIDPTDALAWWVRLDYACHQGSRSHAAWLLQAIQPQLSADGVWLALQTICNEGDATIPTLQTATLPHPEQQILAQMNALLYLCTPADDRPALLEKGAVSSTFSQERDWATWSAIVGRRAARIHHIPAEALHRGTSRGQLPSRYTNVDELRDPVGVLATEGCKWWRDRIAEAGIELDTRLGDAVVYPDDDSLEDFMDTYFPDDIPDEWSAADQAKSHGRGCLETAAPPPPPIQIMEESVDDDVWVSAVIEPVKKLTGLAVTSG